MTTTEIKGHEIVTIADIKRLRPLIKNDWSLCELFDGKPCAKEREVMVAQTIHAAEANHGTYGRPFSIKGGGVERIAQNGGIINNGAAYRGLIEDGYFVEDTFADPSIRVIYPTKKLIHLLDQHFAGEKV